VSWGDIDFWFFKRQPHFFSVNYLIDNFSENFDVSESKFKKVVFKLLNVGLRVLRIRRSMIIGLEDIGAMVI